MVKQPDSSEVVMFGDMSLSRKPKLGETLTDASAKLRQKPRVIEADPGKPMPEPQAPPQAVEPPPVPVQPAPSLPPVANTPEAKPAPKAPPKVKNPASPKEVSKAMAAGSVDSVIGSMREKALQNGGMLSLQDIDAMEHELAAKSQEMEAQFEAALKNYASAIDQQKWNLERANPFSRLMVKQFSHLFKEPAGRKSVHRRMLPGFYQAISMLLGPETVGRYHERCEGIVARIQADLNDEPFDWEMFYNEKDALTVSLDAQLLIAAGFQDFDKRSKWFMDLVNSNLTPPADDASAGEKAWSLSEQGFRRMLDALCGNLRKVISSEKGRERMMKRHGRDAVAVALTTLKRVVTG